MAVLEKIREKTVLVLVMIGLGMFGFLFMGSDQSSIFSCNGEQLNSIGSINGEEIDIDKYNEYLGNLKKQNPEEIAHNDAWNFLVTQKLIGSAASDFGLTITPEELKELETGSINPQNISQYFRDALGKNFEDDTSGTFTNKVENLLASRSQWSSEQKNIISSIEDQVSKDRLSQKYQTLIEKGIYTTNSQVITTLNERNQNAEVKYVSIPYSVEEIEVTDEEILEFYNKNILDYQNKKETRNVEYAAFTVVPSEEDVANFHKNKIKIIKKSQNSLRKIETEAVYERLSDITDPKLLELIKKEEGQTFIDSLSPGTCRISKFDSMDRPDSVESRQILLTKGNFTSDSAETILQDLKKQVENGVDFVQLVKEFSEGPSVNTEGNLGWFSENEAKYSSFIEPCFTSKLGDLKIVETPEGYHLIQLTNVSELVPKYKISYLDKVVVASEETRDDYKWKAKDFKDQFLTQKITESKNKFLQYWWIVLDIGIIFVLLYFIYVKKRNIRRFAPYVVLLAIFVAVAGIYFTSEAEDDAMILTDNNNFRSLADSLNVRYDYADAVNNMQFNIKDLQDSREIIRWMFDVNTKVGDVSNNEPYRCGDDFLVVSLSEINPKGDKTLESVRDIVIQEIQNDQKFDDISSQLSGSTTLDEAASLFNTIIDSVVGLNFESPTINNTITEVLDVQNFVGAVNALDEGETSRLIKGNNTAYLIYIVSKDSITIPENNEIQREQIQNSNSFGLFNGFVLKVLKENSDIVDNRSIFY